MLKMEDNATEEDLDRPLVVWSSKRIALGTCGQIENITFDSGEGFEFAVKSQTVHRISSHLMRDVNRRDWQYHPSLYVNTRTV